MPDQVSQFILQQLLAQGVVKQEQMTALPQSLDVAPAELRRMLVGNHLVNEELFTRLWATAIQWPYIDLKEVKIPRATLDIVPESTSREHQVVAYMQTAELVRLAMADPKDRQIVEFIHKKVNMPVEVALASEEGIRRVLSQYQKSLEVEFQGIVTKATTGIVDNGDLSKAAEDLPIIQTTDAILKHAILQKASDIHIEPLEKEVIVRYRVDGILREVLRLDKPVQAGVTARIKILSNLKIDEHRLPQDGRFKIETEDYNVAFRVSILPVFDGEKVVMRLLDESGKGITLEQIGMGKRTLEIFRRNVQKPHGMVLVTGPTGSGKTTTLYAAMQELNTADVNISTVEDPIEYRMPRVNQTQVKPEIGLTFANGLRALVRQDPDIIMVGEIRDEETASLAVNAALTGHLVLSTLHTNSAAGALPRLLDMKVEAFLVSSTTNILLAQRLVRQLCDKCRKQIPVTKAVLDSLIHFRDLTELLKTLQREGAVPAQNTWEQVGFYEAVGCEHCREGYIGRTGIYELMEVTAEIQAIMSATTTSKQLEDAARKQQQMVSMLEDGIIKVIQGTTSLSEVLRVAKE